MKLDILDTKYWENLHDESMSAASSLPENAWSRNLGKVALGAWNLRNLANQCAMGAPTETAKTEYPMGTLDNAQTSVIDLATKLAVEKARVDRLQRALSDAISTYDPEIEEIRVSAERQEAWADALIS